MRSDESGTTVHMPNMRPRFGRMRNGRGDRFGAVRRPIFGGANRQNNIPPGMRQAHRQNLLV